MFSIIVSQIIKMLLLLCVGILCYHLRLIDQTGSKAMTNLLLMVVNPAVALMSLQSEYRPEVMSGLLLSYALAIVTHLIMILVSNLLIRKDGNTDFAVERFSAMYSNCGFIGIPLVQSVLGNEAVLYLTAYVTAFNIFSWTHGVWLMTGSTSVKNIRKGLASPMIIASLIGLVLFFFQIMFPPVVADTLNYIAGINTPLAMIIAGVSVAQTSISSILKNPRIYLNAAIKLLLMPAIVFAILLPLQASSIVACTILLAAACPTAATCTVFTLRYHKNSKYAAELYTFSTLCSLITIPMFVYAAERFL